jgi:hypothetical protein
MEWPEEIVRRKEVMAGPRYTFESMIDQPCNFHTPNLSKPANHTTR